MEFTFRPDREAHLRTLCEEMGKSVDEFVNEAVLTFMEDYEDGRDGKAAMAEHLASGEPMITMEEMMRKYGLEDSDLAESPEAGGPAGQGGTTPGSQVPANTPARAA